MHYRITIYLVLFALFFVSANLVHAAASAAVHPSVPFTVQAPFANWDATHEEACEEAAALIVHRYWQHQPFRSKQDAENGILDLVAFQKMRYGFFEDTTAAQTARFIRARWGYTRVDVVKNPTITSIKKEIANGYPVIVPTAGRLLGNPNFTRPGPLYHMVVITGYTANGYFITNDPGTRKGLDYQYKQSVLMNALHDWNGGKVSSGAKVIIIVRPNR